MRQRTGVTTLGIIRRLLVLTSAPHSGVVGLMLLLIALMLLAAAASGCNGFVNNPDIRSWNQTLKAANHRMTPQWSPDGSHITFALPRGSKNIVVVPVDGSSVRRITKGDGRYELDYSPDGTQVVYATSKYWTEGEGIPRIKRNFEIETSAPDGTDRRRLTINKDHDISPVWSPDGSRIAFAKFAGNDRLFIGIYTMAADGSDRRMVVAANRVEDYGTIEMGDRLHKAGPVWSPDGDTLAYVIDEIERIERDSSGSWLVIRDVLYSVSADGSGLTRLFTTEGDDRILGPPAWSPDGEVIAFIHFKEDESEPSWGIKTLHTIRPGGSELRRLADTPYGSGSEDASLSWSPDGTKILFSMPERHRLNSVHWEDAGATYVVNADGTRVLHAIGKGLYSSWSPDGSRIASLGPHGEYVFGERPVAEPSDVFLSTTAPDGSNLQVLLRMDGDGRLIPENGKGRRFWPF